MYRVYGLVDPRDLRLFYVGRTAKKLSMRLKEHLNETESISLKQQRIKAIMNETDKPITPVLLQGNILTEKQAFTREVYWMEVFLQAGAELTNASIDFDGTYFLREDTISKHPHVNYAPKGSSEVEGYTSATEHWEEDIGANVREIRRDDFFKIEDVLDQGNALLNPHLSPGYLNARRLQNKANNKPLNHGLPVMDEEIRLLLRYFVKTNSMEKLKNYFQRSEYSIRKMIAEHYEGK